MGYTTRSLLWLLSAALIAPIAWSTAAAFLGFILFPMPRDIPTFLFGIMIGSIWGAAVTAIFVLPYGLFLVAWPWLARAFPAAERTPAGLTLATASLALPAAFIVGVATGEFAGTIRAKPFMDALLAAFVGGWLGLLVPRLIIKSLSPGSLIAGRVSNRGHS